MAVTLAGTMVRPLHDWHDWCRMRISTLSNFCVWLCRMMKSYTRKFGQYVHSSDSNTRRWFDWFRRRDSGSG